MNVPSLKIKFGSIAESRLLNATLLLAGLVQFYLYITHIGDERSEAGNGHFWDTLYLASLLLLAGALVFRHFYQIRLNRRSESGRQQLDAMISMFSSVKHDLNNDMQVVLGNAELAEMLISTDADAQKPVGNITQAANAAIERIEQLSVFNAVGNVVLKPIDLNAVLRESMTKLATEIPPIVTLRLELEHLNTRVMADKYLLSLSLTHLVRQAVNSMRHGGEIVVNSSEITNASRGVSNASVRAELYMVRALSLPRAHTPAARSARESAVEDAYQMEDELRTTKALVERSGAQAVRLSAKADESLFSMSFGTEQKPHAAARRALGGELFN